MLNRFIILASALSLGACATPPCCVMPDPLMSPATDWVAHSTEWREEAEAVYAEASEYVLAEAENRPAESWAVVFDLDETVINNVQYQIQQEAKGDSYTPESWYAWTQKAEATLVPGVADFIDLINEAGGFVVFVTNRSDREQLATEINLHALGLERGEDFRILMTRARPKGVSNKSPRYALIGPMLAAQGYPDVTVIAYVGDNKGDKPDLAGEWSFFCIDQGAMYGDPCAAVPGPGR